MDFYEALYAVNPALWHVGVTATPIRADGQGLKVAYEKVSATFDIRYLVKAKYLVPPRWLAIQTGISLEHVATRRGADGESDFVTKQLADVFETDNCFELVVESYRKYAAQRQAIAFTATVDGAYRLADKFKDAGISAEAADGATNKQDRSQILQRFRKGEVDVLCNVGLYTEGLDVPEVSCILNVRPTKSDGLYLQMIGRGLRIADWAGKHDCVILDFSPQDSRQVVFLGDVLGTPIRKDVYIKERKEPGEVSGGFTFDGEFKWLVGDPSEIVSRELDYLDMSPFSWYKRDGWMTLGLGPGPVDEHERILAVSAPNEDGQVTLWKISRARGKKHYAARRGETASLDIVLAITDEISEQYGNRTLAMRQKKWRKNQPSPASIGYAENLGTYLAGMNQGQVSDAITHGLAMRAIRQIEQGE